MYASSYCVTNRRHSNKRSCPDSDASDDEIFEFSKWFVVQPADDKISLNSLTAFTLGKAVKAQIGTLVTAMRTAWRYTGSDIQSHVCQYAAENGVIGTRSGEGYTSPDVEFIQRCRSIA